MQYPFGQKYGILEVTLSAKRDRLPGKHMATKSHSAKGTYMLLIRLDQAHELNVGRLGSFPFPPGWYAYVGSALGPGGLDARVARHARKIKRTHWHVDYLLKYGVLVETWQLECPNRLECHWATTLARSPNAQRAVYRFGASDCRCPGHLVYWRDRPDRNTLQKALDSASPRQCILSHTTHTQ
jgi:Uri superfamily endonuclease